MHYHESKPVSASIGSCVVLRWLQLVLNTTTIALPKSDSTCDMCCCSTPVGLLPVDWEQQIRALLSTSTRPRQRPFLILSATVVEKRGARHIMLETIPLVAYGTWTLAHHVSNVSFDFNLSLTLLPNSYHIT